MIMIGMPYWRTENRRYFLSQDMRECGVTHYGGIFNTAVWKA
jgi:hypothetical protein